MSEKKGDFAFRSDTNMGRWHEMTYGGALSFLRRRYSRDLDGVDVAVTGIPFDNAVTNRPGCRLGPRALRAASTELAELDAFPFGFNLFERLNIVDYGDCHIDPHHPDTVAQSIMDHAAEIINGGATMVSMGGDHFVTYPLLRAHAEKYGPLALIQFDAHCDTWEDDGANTDHGTMFARAVAEGIIDVSKSSQIGLRTWNDLDAGFLTLDAPWVHKHGIDAALAKVKERAGDAPTYLTWDIDGFDPAFAPGTGTPVSGGLASWQGLEFLRGLTDVNIVGMDLVEVSPPFDHAEMTAILGATVLHDFMCLLAQKKE